MQDDWSRRRLPLTCGATALAGCNSGGTNENTDPNATWSTFGFDSANTGYSPDATIPSSSDDPEWTVPLGGYPYTSPIAGDDAVVVGSESNGIESFETASGKLLWRTPVDGIPAGTPAIENEDVFVTVDTRLNDDGGAFVRALDLNTGSERWRTRVADEAAFAPTVSGESLYVRTTTALHALDRTDGSVRWSVTDRPTFAPEDYDVTTDIAPAVANGTVYAPDPEGLVAIDASSGSVEWEVQTTKIRSAPAVDADRVYLADVSDGVYALDRRDGRELWSWNASGCWTSPAVEADRVYVTAGFDVAALDATDGSESWRTESDDGLHGDVYASPAVGREGLVVGSIERTVAVIREPGTVIWEDPDGGTRTSPAVADGRVYVIRQGSSTERPSLVAFE
ncbi:hypothetical protein BRD03_10650 [Halobacteriales archaeon QS_9_68_17]|nr:MAG: hypothetical protein BRD03_10650 [Halobacteriales archaeon QS_9_68_17]